LCVPVRTQDEVIGALQVLNKPGGFSESDAELLQFLAVYAASAIESERLRREAEAARLLRRELDIAREVQRCLFPQDLTAIPYLDYAALCRPHAPSEATTTICSICPMEGSALRSVMFLAKAFPRLCSWPAFTLCFEAAASGSAGSPASCRRTEPRGSPEFGVRAIFHALLRCLQRRPE